MSGVNLAHLEAELEAERLGHELGGLYSGATGQPAHGSPADERAQLRHQQRNLGWADATPLLHDAAQAYREVMGSRRQRELAAEQPSRSTYL